MDERVPVRIRLVGEIGQLEQLVKDVQDTEDGASLSEPRPITNPAEYRLDLGQIAEVVGTLHAVFIGGALAPFLYQRLRDKGSRRITIESPLGRVVLEPHKDLTEAQVRKALRKLTEL